MFLEAPATPRPRAAYGLSKIAVVFSGIALIVSVLSSHHSPFASPTLLVYKIRPDISGTEKGETWWVLARFIQETDAVVIPFSEAQLFRRHQAWLSLGEGATPRRSSSEIAPPTPPPFSPRSHPLHRKRLLTTRLDLA